MGIRIVTPPTVQPIEILGLNALKRHLNEAVDVTDNDDLISSYCAVAWDYCQRYSWRQLLTATLRQTLSAWREVIPICRPPVVSIASVRYYDDANTIQTLDAASWQADLSSDVVEVKILDFPTVYDRPDAIEINYTAGYGTTAAAFPPVLLHAVRLLVGHYYATREPEATDTTTVDALLAAIQCRDERLPEFE